MVNSYYFYCIDDDFGPFFLKFCSYFPYNAKLCINGHEYAKRQLEKRRIGYTALDNGVLECDDPKTLQKICNDLSAERIDRLLRKWLKRLPHPFPARDRKAGFRYDISILQAEFAKTQVFDRPIQGRVFFEQVIRENIDIGRPEHVQLIFDRRVTRRTPSRYRTRVISDGVIPSLHVDYKHSRIKQYYKEGRALRTETVVNNTYDFDVGRRLQNLPALREIGFSANRRLLRVQQISHDPSIGSDVFERLQKPRVDSDRRTSALRFGDLRVQALLVALLWLRLAPTGFRNRDLRQQVAGLLALSEEQYTASQMTYDMRRLRGHGLIERVPRTHTYHLTDEGARIALILTRGMQHVIRPALSAALDPAERERTRLGKALRALDGEIEHLWQQTELAA
jgi:hypothetical protein